MSDRPWEVFASDAVAPPKEAVLERGKTDQPAAPRRLVRVEEAKLPGAPPLDHIALADGQTTSAESYGRGRSGRANHLGRIGRDHRGPGRPTPRCGRASAARRRRGAQRTLER